MIRSTMLSSPLVEPPQPSLPTIDITGKPEQSGQSATLRSDAQLSSTLAYDPAVLLFLDVLVA